MHSAFLGFFILIFITTCPAWGASYDFAPPPAFQLQDSSKDSASWRDAHGRALTLVFLERVHGPVWTPTRLRTALPIISKARAELLSQVGIAKYKTTSASLITLGSSPGVLMSGLYEGLDGKSIWFMSVEVQSKSGLWTLSLTQLAPQNPNGSESAARALLSKFRVSSGDREPAQESSGLRGSLDGQQCDPASSSSLKSIASVATGLNDQLCAHVDPKKRKRFDTDPYYSGVYGTTQWIFDTKTIPAFALGCSKGILDIGLDAIKGIVNLVMSGVYLSIDPAYRATVSASLNLLWAEAKRDPAAFSKRIVSLLAGTLSQSASDWFNCLHPRAQFEQTCNLLGQIGPTSLAMILTFGPKAFAMVKTAQKALEKLKVGVMSETASGAKSAEALAATAPKVPVRALTPEQIRESLPGLGAAEKEKLEKLIETHHPHLDAALQNIKAAGQTSDLEAVLSSSGTSDVIEKRVLALGRQRDLKTGAAEPKSFLELPRATEFSLPGDFKSIVHQHKIMELKSKFGDGENLAINLSHYRADGGIHGTNVGESVQSQMVAKTLKEIFPKATLVGGEPGAPIAGKKTVSLVIRDSAETHLPSNKTLEMAILKSANPGMGAVPHLALRESLGIPKDKFIASVYSQRTGATWERLIGAIEGAKKPDVVFLSAGGTGTRDGLKGSAAAVEAMGYKIVHLSEFDAVKFAPGERYAVINDIAGRMPHIYNVSDVSVVSGPINFMEPLAGGTKTVFMVDEASRRSYRLKEFNDLSEAAVATGGAYPVKNEAMIPIAIRRALNSTSEVTPPYMAARTAAEPTAANRYLDHLYEQFNESLARSAP